MIFRFSQYDDGKEFSIKFLPNFDSIQENTITIQKYFHQGKETDKETCLKNNGQQGISNYSFALVNGEYKIIKYGRILSNLIKLCIDGSFYKVSERFLSVEDFEDTYMNKNKRISLMNDVYKFIDLGGPKNLFNIRECLSIKLKVVYIQGFLSLQNISIEEDKKNLIWDGTEEGKESVMRFLQNKTQKLEDVRIKKSTII